MSFLCKTCDKKINKGYQCAVYSNYHKKLNFIDNYCSKKCLEQYVNEPRIFGSTYVEHFFNKNIERHNIEKDEKFIKKYQPLFLGKVNVPENIKKKNQALDMTSNFLLSLNPSQNYYEEQLQHGWDLLNDN